MEHERLVQSTLAYYSRRSTWFVWILFGWKKCFACLHIWFARCFGSLGMHTNSGSLSLHLPHPILSISKMMTARLVEIPARLCVWILSIHDLSLIARWCLFLPLVQGPPGPRIPRVVLTRWLAISVYLKWRDDDLIPAEISGWRQWWGNVGGEP